MAILTDFEKKLFTIHTRNTTYQMTVGRYGHLLHLYYGRRIVSPGMTPQAVDMRYLLTCFDRGFSGNPYDAGTDRTYSLDALPQEYPCYGTGDYRSTALQVRDARGVSTCDLRYKNARVLGGLYGIPGLPAAHEESRANAAEARPEETQSKAGTTEVQPKEVQGKAGAAEAWPEEGHGKAGTADVQRDEAQNETGAAEARSVETQCKVKPENSAALWSENSAPEAQTLEIVLADAVTGLEVTLRYGVLKDSDVLTRSAVITNAGGGALYLEKAASCCLDFLYGAFDLIHFHGRHGMERQPERTPVLHEEHVLQSRRGASGHQQNPFFILTETKANEESGLCYGFSLLYSGNFKSEACMDQYGQTRALLGISDEQFAWKLEPGESFYTPQAALCCSDSGLAKLSRQFHRFIRRNVCRGEWQKKRRPVLINSWEAAYFDFTGEKIAGIAEEASKLGAELLVLDDGWFGKRDNDLSGLGDWTVNEKKLGCTLGELSKRVRASGMKFGLWIEPEMVSGDSDLYRAHPDWAFVIPGRPPVRARYQLMLDFSRKEVVDHVLDQISEVVRQADISYIKMDMNRHLMDVYTAGQPWQNLGAVLHRYVLGVYDFLERFSARFPHILIEGCAGGGGRFDAGMLYYTPQIWCSDNTDAVERLRIQYGTSFGYPVSAVGSHVSAVPNHQTGRMTDFVTRGVVAMAGTFGYELDPGKLSEEEKERMRLQIQDFKRYYDLIQDGLYWRLSDPLKDTEYAAWEFSAEDGSEALLNLVTLGSHCNPVTEYVRLRGLDPEAVYRIEETKSSRQTGRESGMIVPPEGGRYPGSALMYGGLPVPRMQGEYQAWQVYLRRL